MPRSCIAPYAILFFSCFSAFCVQVFAAPSDALKGIRSFGLIVEPPGSELVSKGYTESWIREQIRLKLKEAHLPLELSNKASWLYINTNAVEQKNGAYAYNIRVDFNEPVTVERNAYKLIASTWSAGVMGSSHRDLPESFKHSLNHALDSFVADFRQANPPLFPASPKEREQDHF